MLARAEPAIDRHRSHARLGKSLIRSLGIATSIRERGLLIPGDAATLRPYPPGAPDLTMRWAKSGELVMCSLPALVAGNLEI